jgi:hypothetical protein
MRERSQADNTVPEAQVVTQPKDVVRWLLIPRWFKALCVGSALFGAMYGSTADLVLATASAVAGILVFVAGATSYSSFRKYRRLRLPS